MTSSLRARPGRSPWARKLSAAALVAAVSAAAALASCSSDLPDAFDQGAGSSGQSGSCATPQEGCTCPVEGQVVDCGKVTQQTGTFIECAHGNRTCVGGRWGACVGDGVTQTRSISGGLSPLALATDAGPCTGNPCDPNCASYLDTPVGLEVRPDSGVVVTDAGLTLPPIVPAGAACTSLTIAANTTALTVSKLAPLTTTPASIAFTPTFLPAGCATPGTQPTWVLDQPTIATVSATGSFVMADAVAGPIVVRAFFATSATVLQSNAVTVNVAVRAKEEAQVPPNKAAPAADVGKFFTDPGHTTWATPTKPSDATWLYPYADTWLPVGLLAPVVQYKVAASPGNTAKISLRYPVGASASSALFDYSFFVGEQSNFYPNKANFPSGPNADSKDGQAVIPQGAWRVFEQTVKGNNAELVVQRVVGSSLQQENRLRLRIVDGQMKGTVYYASYDSPLAGNTGAVLAIRPGASAPVVAVQNGGQCTVCHSLNSKGDYLVANGRNSGGYSYDESRRYDVAASGTPVNDYTGSKGNRFAYGGAFPDGAFYMSHYGDGNWHANGSKSQLYRTSDAATLSLTNWPNDVSAVTPTFSSDGTKLAFGFWGGSRIEGKGPSANKARLVVADFDCDAVDGSCTSSSRKVTNARDLTPGNSATVGWPSFLPDAKSVVFQKVVNRSNAQGWSPSEINTIAGGMDELWMSTVPPTTATAAKSARLNALNGYTSSGASYLPTAPRDVTPLRPNYHGEDASIAWKTDSCKGPYTTDDVNDTQLNYMPRVAPKEAGGVYWVVFSSRRMYGNVAWDNPWASQGGSCRSSEVPTQKLWVAAIDKNWNGTGDPSHPAFYLPGQELLAGNNKGYWVDSPCAPAGDSCEATADCCQAPAAQVCRVVPNSSPAARRCEEASSCVGTGAACMTDSECCGNGARCLGVSGSNPGVCALNQAFSSGTFTRDYDASCRSGFRPVWQLFRWQAVVPSGTSIDFRAQTASRLPDGGAAGWGVSVPVGTATTTTAGWVSGPQTVDQALRAAGDQSRELLRITMSFQANGLQEAPVLTQWDQLFDCVPAE